MLEALGGSMVSLIRDLSLEKTKKEVVNTAERKQLSNKIDEQIKRYEKEVFINLDEKERFDLNRVNQYIKGQLFDKVSACFNLPEAYQRESARRNLIEAAYTESGVDTSAQKTTVYHYIQKFLQIVEFHYLEKIDDKELFLAGKTMDEALSAVQHYLEKAENRIMDAVRYHGSFAEYINGISSPRDNANAFHYRNELLKFRGRETELKVLKEFMEADEGLSWMAVTGAGGSGKSKLLYHFVKEMEIYPGWKSVWIHSENCEQFLRFNEWKYPYNLLIVVDYAGAVASDMGKWMEQLERSRYRPGKMRFVFVEREGKGENNSVPLWYQNLTGSGEQARCVERLGFKRYNGTPFLQLLAMENSQLEEIIKDYAKVSEKRVSDEQIKWILKKAKEIDHKQGNARVLIVIFTADAVLQEREYKNWDMQHLIDEIIKKYSDHWREVTCGNDESLYQALREMLMFSTAVGAWEPGQEVPEMFENSATILCSMDADKLEQLICEVNEEKQFEGKLKPLEPDLIGEYYVLDYWKKKKYDRRYLQNVVKGLWEYPWNFLLFILRCVENYGKQPVLFLFQKSMLRLIPLESIEQLLFPIASIFLVAVFQWLLENLTEEQESVDRLEELNRRNEGNEEIALRYAQSLLSLSWVQEEKEAKESIRGLKKLSESYGGNEEIILAYTMGLFNISLKQEEEEASRTREHLDEIRKKYRIIDEWFEPFFQEIENK